MKKIFNFFAFAVLASTLLVSCSKGDYNSGDKQTGYNRYADKNNKPKDVPTGTFTAKVNGSAFSAAYANAYEITSGGVTAFTIVGFKTYANADGFTFSLRNKAKGVVSLGTENVASYKGTGSPSAIIAESGTFEITELTDTRVKGKFDMKGAGGVDVTDGVFDLPIINYNDYYKQ